MEDVLYLYSPISLKIELESDTEEKLEEYSPINLKLELTSELKPNE